MRSVLSRLWSSRAAKAALLFLALVAALGLAAPVLPVPDPAAIDAASKLASPSASHLLGTDRLGRDLLSRLLFGIRTTVFWSAAALFLTALIGAAAGAAAGWLRGKADFLIMRLTDVMMSFPAEVLILAIVGFAGPGIENAVLACVAVKWAWYARMTRGIVRRLALSGAVKFARTAGASGPRIIASHLFPTAAGELAVLMTVDAGSVVLLLSTLSFLGLGVQPPGAEWGMMLAEAKEVMTLYPWQMIPPGIAIIAVVSALSLLGDALRDALDPRHIPGHLQKGTPS